MKIRDKFIVSALVMLSSQYSNAADYDIGGVSSGPLAKVNEILQEFVNFVSGPIALAFCFISLAIAAAVWAIAPKLSGILGTCARVIVGVIAFLNIAGWMAHLTA